MKIEELMTHECATVRPSDDLNDAAHLMWTHDCGALPVVDEDRRVAGMLTDRDICMCAYHRGQELRRLRVLDAMSEKVLSCSVSDDVSKAQELMREAQVRRLPVTGPDGRLQGILTLAQIARAGGDAGSREVSKDHVADTLAAISRPLKAAQAV